MGRMKPQSVSPDYVVGLTDGEGCFYVLIVKSSLYRAGAKAQLHFHIKMQEADRSVLEKVKKTLGCGAVYFQKEKRPNHTQCYRYTVASTKDVLEKVIPFFKKHPLQTFSKRKNFELFSRIAYLMERQEHKTKRGLEKIQKLKAQMNQRTNGLA
jgi:hypothetical protein